MNLTAGELHTSCTRVPAYPEHRSISSGTGVHISCNSTGDVKALFESYFRAFRLMTH